MDLEFWVNAVFPVAEEDGADGTMEAASKEGEDRAVGGRRGRVADLRGDISGEEVDLGDADVFLGTEAFRGVGVAKGSDGVVE